jgi:esterase/lipase superfamily enzyme
MGAGAKPPLAEIAAEPRHRRRLGLGLPLLLALAGCASDIYRMPFMPPPAFLEDGEVPLFSDPGPVQAPADPQILYATLRQPAAPGGKDRFYSPERATELRLGTGRVVLAREGASWELARRMSILKGGADKYPLQVDEVQEIGVLDRTFHPALARGGTGAPGSGPRERFVAEIDRRLAKSRDPDIFIYVHGFKVNFENPILVSAELWHFLGYEGVFLPFSWPSNLGLLDYFGDTESARYSAIFLRGLIEFLAEETQVRRIHILGYSAGTRLVAAALNQLALVNRGRSAEEVARRLRLGNVILVGSDIDRGIFATYLMDGLLQVQERLTIYESHKDQALGAALLAFRRNRVGQLDPSDLNPEARRFLFASDALSLISVANAPGYESGNGHSYFRDSPLVSSDILATLRYDLGPAERGLVQDRETGIWGFPPDYLERLEGAVFPLDPQLARRAGPSPPP